jgi:hypothetical protein
MRPVQNQSVAVEVDMVEVVVVVAAADSAVVVVVALVEAVAAINF